MLVALLTVKLLRASCQGSVDRVADMLTLDLLVACQLKFKLPLLPEKSRSADVAYFRETWP
jgi:hypothetical protein